jgi:beclin 1
VNEIFRINAVDEIGTIGGLRLGRTQKQDQISWDEINAAMGQVVYLLVVLAHRFGYSLEKHKLYVNGAFSKIQRLDGGQAENLYRDRDEVSFNKGMKELLICLQMFMIHVSSEEKEIDPSIKLYKIPISDNKIGNCSIEYGSSKDTWTQACKAMLTNLSYL